MCSSLLGLGGTYVQQCFVCLFPQYLFAAFSCVLKSNSMEFNLSLLSYMSYQHHAGLQPANLVTSSHVLRSRVLQMMMLSVYSGSIITFRESIFFFTSSVVCYKLTDSKGYIYRPACRCCTVRVVVPYEIITYVLDPPVFFGITYGAVFVPDLQYALRRQLRTVRDNSVRQSVKKGPTVATA